MSMYFAPAFFSHLLGKCLRRQNPIFQIMKLGTVVLATFAVVWWPYVYSVEAIKEVKLNNLWWAMCFLLLYLIKANGFWYGVAGLLYAMLLIYEIFSVYTNLITFE